MKLFIIIAEANILILLCIVVVGCSVGSSEGYDELIYFPHFLYLRII